MKHLNPGHVIAHASCRLKLVSEVCDEQKNCGDIWVYEVEMLMITEVKTTNCLACLIIIGAWAKGISGQVLGGLLKLMQGQVIIWIEIRCHQIP